MVRDRTNIIEQEEDEDSETAPEDSTDTTEQISSTSSTSASAAELTADSAASEREDHSQGTPHSGGDTDAPDDEPTQGAGEEEQSVNIREDWDASTYYIEPSLSDTLDDEFRKLRREMKREEEVIVEKHKHFFQAILEVGIEENLEDVVQKAREKAKQDTD